MCGEMLETWATEFCFGGLYVGEGGLCVGEGDEGYAGFGVLLRTVHQ